MNIDGSEMSRLLSLSQDELLEEIGEELIRKRLRARLEPRKTETAMQRGQEWFEANIGHLERAVCFEPAVRRMVENPSDNQVLVAALLDLISSIVVGVSPVTVAVLLVKRGVHTLCRDSWDKTSGEG